jgi:hypothetical protein
LSTRVLPFFYTRSAAFATSSMEAAAFKLALLGAIVRCFLVARTVGAKYWNLLIQEQQNPIGRKRE